MRHSLTIFLATAALLPACPKGNVEGSDTGTSGTEGASSTGTTESPDPTGGIPTSTSSTTSGTTAAVTSTDATDTEPVTTATSTTGMITTTGATTSEETTSGSDSSTGDDYGLCGWNPDKNYYACMSDGGIPGMIDSDHPIDCPPGVTKGDPCTEDGEINNYGCCTPEGVLYYCEITETNKVIETDCNG